MIRSRFTNVGLDRLIRLSWLDKTVSLVIAGNNVKDIKAILQNDLQTAFRSQRTDVRGSLDKTITILMQIWVTVPDELKPLHTDAIKILKQIPRYERTAIHWGMITAVYPFWSGVAAQTGRLLRLQGSAVALQVQRRVREQYGERETVSRRARYVLRSYVDWDVLKESSKKGIYSAATPLAVDDSTLIAWLVEASLLSRPNSSADLKELINSPALFPFRIRTLSAENLAAVSPRLDIIRHGLTDELVMLRK